MTKIAFTCSQCGNNSPKWIGKCPICNKWNTYKEKFVNKPVSTQNLSESSYLNRFQSNPLLLKNIQKDNEIRMNMIDQEFNRVLGEGLVPGSLVLIGGEPGIGKSTFVLQTILKLKYKTLYISGEESTKQLKLRAERLNIENENCFIVCETNLETILDHINHIQPNLVVIDSIQTLFTERIKSSPGTISQIRENASILLTFAKKNDISFLLIGHINKEGNIAGPKILEHIVDTVLQFEGDKSHMYRILRNIKNRFGNTAELGIYEMRQNGLREVSNPSELLLSQNYEGLSGIAIAAVIEGIRAFLIETQALVSKAAYGGVPQRSSTGFDIYRMNMLLAVLEKKVGFKLSQKDVFLNIVGGLRIIDPAIDLSVVSAILSSNLDISIKQETCMCGEIGLSGEIRPVSRIESRISEAEKLGFQRIIIPTNNLKEFNCKQLNITIKPVKKVEEAFKELFK
ncbi:MAG: DNA repair protein RadA [Candidatus Azobacteroides pseudotrichonymphae]|jgi:DNA repair protein RadA/Sms|nr:DNA repair protein RadA [Bacteroidales bacterium OttesenSCG-928-I14]GMO37140.1 MAG: DNA repair protein RadA [Candidatus Azobacteroides pseudotrichonymphae]